MEILESAKQFWKGSGKNRAIVTHSYWFVGLRWLGVVVLILASKVH